MTSTTDTPTTDPRDTASGGREVQVLYFAALREQVGRAEEQLTLPAGEVRVAELVRLLEAKHPQLRLDAVRVALNEEFADASAPVAPGDVVALIPPVSGG